MLQAVRAAVITAALRLLDAGLVRGTSGNVSARDGDLVAVTPTGVDYRRLDAASVPVVGLDGRVVDGRLAPSSELPLHLAVYRARPDVGAVVHTHSTFATTFAVLGEELPAVRRAVEAVVALFTLFAGFEGDDVPALDAEER